MRRKEDDAICLSSDLLHPHLYHPEWCIISSFFCLIHWWYYFFFMQKAWRIKRKDGRRQVKSYHLQTVFSSFFWYFAFSVKWIGDGERSSRFRRRSLSLFLHLVLWIPESTEWMSSSRLSVFWLTDCSFSRIWFCFHEWKTAKYLEREKYSSWGMPTFFRMSRWGEKGQESGRSDVPSDDDEDEKRGEFFPEHEVNFLCEVSVIVSYWQLFFTHPYHSHLLRPSTDDPFNGSSNLPLLFLLHHLPSTILLSYPMRIEYFAITFHHMIYLSYHDEDDVLSSVEHDDHPLNRNHIIWGLWWCRKSNDGSSWWPSYDLSSWRGEQEMCQMMWGWKEWITPGTVCQNMKTYDSNSRIQDEDDDDVSLFLVMLYIRIKPESAHPHHIFLFSFSPLYPLVFPVFPSFSCMSLQTKEIPKERRSKERMLLCCEK